MLSACKAENYKVTFLSNGAVYAEVSVKKGETIKLPNEPTKKGYTFDCWVYADDTTVVFDGSGKITENITVTAKWTLKEIADDGGENYTDGLLFAPTAGGYRVSVGTAANEAEIVIPRTYNGEKVIEIDGSFKDCTRLIKLTIPFVGATLDGKSDAYFGYIFGASSYIYNSSSVAVSLREVIVTGGTSIAGWAFSGCGKLTSITLPAVTSIGYGAFEKCYSLASITLLEVVSIGSEAFAECRDLTSITLPESLISIGGFVFSFWTSSQTIYIKGRDSSPEGWDINWYSYCGANIVWNA
jgi:uncharacterized repeat protein (TIGR02543 family)